MNMKSHRPLVGATARNALVGLVLAWSVPLLAETPFYTGRVVVDIDNIDLTRANAQSKLESRVSAAVTTLCGQPVLGTHEEADALAACRSDARASADPQIKALLTQARTKVAVAD